jgi:hypothetical protein
MNCIGVSGALARRSMACVWLLAAAAAIPASAASLQSVRPDREALFERNLGQYDAEILYRGRFGSLDAAIRSDASLAVYPRDGTSVITIAPKAARASPSFEAVDPSEYRTHYFRAGPERAGIADVPHFGRVIARDVYPGIDLAVHSRDRRLEFDFVVAPGADPRQIALVIGGAKSLSLQAGGDLSIDNGRAQLTQRKPVAYQTKGGVRTPVDCRYRLVDKHTIALVLGKYDRALPLVIDPVVDYSSYIGGSGEDAATAVKPGPGGYIYVAGWTNSSNFPVANAFDASLGGTDVFVAKIDPATGRPVYSTYIGGRNVDSAVALAVDAAGSAYVAGTTGGRYPTTTGAYQAGGTAPGGFVTKLTAAGNALAYSTMLNGTRPAAIDVDSSGRAVVTGAAGASFATTPGALQPVHGGSATTDSGDAFVLMLNAAGSAPVFATFYGGLGTDLGQGIAIDSANRIVIGGTTGSSNLPSVDAFQPAFGGGTNDGFVAAFNATGSSLQYASYLGGTDTDEIRSLAADPYGNVVVTGRSWSTNFPIVNARLPRSALTIKYVDFNNQPVYRKAFVAKISPSPLRLAFSTYGGSNANCCDEAYSVAADAAGEIYVVGSLNIDEFTNLVQVNAIMTTSYVASRYAGSNSDAIFASGYSRDGRGLRFQTLVAGCGDAIFCNPAAVGARAAGQAAVAGQSAVDWHPTTAANTQAARGSTGFGADAFAMTLGIESPPIQLGVSDSQPTSADTVTLTAASYGAGTSGTVTFWDGDTSIGTAALSEGVATLATTLSPGVRRLTVTLGPTRSPLVLVPVTVSGTGS